MNKATLSASNQDASNQVETEPFYHGTRAELKPGDLIDLPNDAGDAGAATYVHLTPNLDAAIWQAELAVGESPGRVYIVEPTGQIVDASDLADKQSPGHPWASLCSRDPLRVIGEVTEWALYHGTRANLRPGDLIAPGYNSNYGSGKAAAFVYLARTLDAAIWGAELAVGAAPARIYMVEPTGPIEDDPNVTDKRFRGNPTKSFRSREPLRVTGEVTDWQGHPAEVLNAMKENLARLNARGIEAIED